MNYSDRDFWFSLDKHLPQCEFDNKVKLHQGYVILNDDKPMGLLRYNLFWDNTPFCNMLYIDPKYQKRGFGTVLMKHWENEMTANGFKILLTSTQSNEAAQHFYRKLGYKDCGGLIIDSTEPLELFLIKKFT